MSIVVRLAKKNDMINMLQLLEKANLNTEGLAENLDNFLVVEDVRQSEPYVVGMVGLEIYGDLGILRSLVLRSESWNSKVGVELLSLIIGYGWKKGLREIYLMTQISQDFFEYWGFVEVTWDDLPEHLRQSSQFHEYDSRYVTLMRLQKSGK